MARKSIRHNQAAERAPGWHQHDAFGLTWSQLQQKAKAAGVLRRGMKRAEVEAALSAVTSNG